MVWGKSQAFFCVPIDMRERIMNYLVLSILENPDFEHDVGRRMKCAWILAQKKYLKLDEQEIRDILYELRADDEDYLEQGNWD
jgi:hypothetical protein